MDSRLDDERMSMISDNMSINESSILEETVFDRTDVRILYIGLYTAVFCCCFFGNLLVILVVTLSRRLRSITNFFLANLAVADFCVGVFCVYQNLSLYLISSWVLGDFMCKMYYFIHSLSSTASIFILVVICMERYFAIIHPITCRQILTPTLLRLVIASVWIASALYSSPLILWVSTTENELGNFTEIICRLDKNRYDSEVFDVINFVLLYLVPLAIMSVLYTRIGLALWRSARLPEPQRAPTARYATVDTKELKLASSAASSANVLRARRGVVRMLIVVVLAFAICNVPYHARKMWQHWSSGYQGGSDLSHWLTPLTNLSVYLNSGLNPLLYAFLSRNFRRGMKELLVCALVRPGSSSRRSPGSCRGYSHRDGGDRLHRAASTRSTLKTNATTVTVLQMDNSEYGQYL